MARPERLISRHAEQPGLAAALLFALVAERLMLFYEHGQMPGDGPLRQQALGWLERARVGIDSRWLRELAAASGEMAREIVQTLSREAGLQTAHEMNESLDPNHASPIGQVLMAQCVDRVDALQREGTDCNEDALR